MTLVLCLMNDLLKTESQAQDIGDDAPKVEEQKPPDEEEETIKLERERKNVLLLLDQVLPKRTLV